MTFQGNIQVAVAEARTLVESGGRVVFFGASTGELERLAEIFQEYSVPFQLGIEPSDATPSYLAERAYLAGAVASTFLVKGLIRRGVVFPEARLAIFGTEDLFGPTDWVARPARAKPQSGRLRRRPGRPQAQRLRGSSRARHRALCRPSRDRSR